MQPAADFLALCASVGVDPNSIPDATDPPRARWKASRGDARPCRRRLTDEERTTRRHRKRKLGGSSALPDTLRHHYTEGERAALCVVAGEVKRRGICDLTIKEIGDRAGVGMTTVQNALHEARRLGHVKVTERPQRGRKSLPNIVEITSAEWRTWIKRAPAAARLIGSNSFKNANATKTTERQKGAFKEERSHQWLHSKPPDTLARRA